ncbi:hypothetical protein BW13_04615 [Bifidobacterium sp. UTCIF-37]|uniref:DUF3592 domain-containing protein n=1 Tax=Bifidobacterium callitrichos TaxID=762209 RepID=A0A2T3G976_9BIFI|nr:MULTISPECIES: DUF3592 domain-containing protein [Bifidobacterium]PST46034.1 hypothetical protein CPA40_08145 [Bifidobacterium callitrichos]TPF86789.1 hypothetical protein BW13_04615 [Bifidobacterium sp. UTCIF-37]TPF89932.1 hypothetical protein BW11_04615 [Bifidobacterium sp. UTCIF-38]
MFGSSSAIVGGVLFAAGLIVLLIALVVLQRIRMLHSRCTARTRGTVIRFVEHENDWNLTLTPEIRYDADGRERTVLAAATAGLPDMHLDERTDVAYDPTHPDVAYLPADRHIGSMARTLTAAGAVCLVAGAALAAASA